MENSQTKNTQYDNLAQLILKDSKDFAEAARRLYHARKTVGCKVSLGYLCRKTGIPSTGYLSDVFNGKKPLAKKYVTALAQAFELSQPLSDVFIALLRLGTENSASAVLTLELSRKRLNVITLPISDNAEVLFLALDIFAAFGLFKGKPHLSELTERFKFATPAQISVALALLKNQGLITSETGDGFHLVQSQAVFQPVDNSVAAEQFIQLALSDAKQHVPQWFTDRLNAYFTSQSVSINHKSAPVLLEMLRQVVEDFLNEIETKDGDQLMRFNLQFYPI